MLEISRRLKKTLRKELQKSMTMTFGNVQTDPSKDSFLELEMDITLYEYINREKVKTDYLIALTKGRRDRIGKESSEVQRYRDVREIEKNEEIE